LSTLALSCEIGRFFDRVQSDFFFFFFFFFGPPQA
jgi:hypothetical protein